jgi:hypothetical protein
MTPDSNLPLLLVTKGLKSKSIVRAELSKERLTLKASTPLQSNISKKASPRHTESLRDRTT